MSPPSASRVVADVKAGLGLEKDYTPFDAEILIHINTAFMTLFQVGVGRYDASNKPSVDGFEGKYLTPITISYEVSSIYSEENDPLWTSLLSPNNTSTSFDQIRFEYILAVRDFVIQEVKMLFDPPQNSFVSEARQRMRDQLLWRIMTQTEYFYSCDYENYPGKGRGEFGDRRDRIQNQ